MVLAESEPTVRVEGNQYFPPESVHREFFTDSPTTSQCPWKGSAKYYTVTAGGADNPDAAWYYPQPLPAAQNIRDHVAFWGGVKVAKLVNTGVEAGRSKVSSWAKLTGRR